MKSRTSFFSPTVFRKDLTRFAPVWVLYGVGLLLALLVIRGRLAVSLAESMGVMAAVELCYALVVGQVLFGDLFQSRMCNALHAMPLRRDCWFLTHMAAGLFFFLVPTGAMAALAAVQMGKFAWVAGMWLLGCLLEYLCFFGVSVFSALSSGNRVGMALIYALINFVSLIAQWLSEYLLDPLFYGLSVPAGPFRRFCPVWSLIDRDFFKTAGGYYSDFQDAKIKLVSEGWIYACVYAAVGLALIGLALYLYRRRKLECAGDLIVVKALVPVFLTVYTLSAGVLFTTFFMIFGTVEIYSVLGMTLLAVGLAVGYYTGRMLLRRTVKVFQPKSLLGLAGIAVGLAVIMVAVYLDPMRVTYRVPEREEIQAVSIGDYSLASEDFLSEEDAISAALELHRSALEYRAPERAYPLAERYSFTLTYRLKDGSILSRTYAVPMSDPAVKGLKKPWSDCQVVLGLSKEEIDAGSYPALRIYINGTYIEDPQQVHEVLEALAQDCQEGNLCQLGFVARWDSSLYMEIEEQDYNQTYFYHHIAASPDAQHIIGCLIANGWRYEDGRLVTPEGQEAYGK